MLGVPRDATDQQVKRAYRQRAKEHHPDLHPGSGPAVRMAEINAAHELLADRGRRAAWDAAHPVVVADPAPRPGSPRGPGGSPGDGGGAAPSLATALGFELTFGKYRGCTLGDVAEREPGYIAWMARTLQNRPGVVRHARVVLAHLEASGWRDTPRPPRSTASTRRDAGERRTSGAGGGGLPGDGTRGGTASDRAGSQSAGVRAAARTPTPTQRHGGQDGLIGIGLAALGGAAWIIGIPPETVSGLVFLVAFVGWPLWMVVQNHRSPLVDGRRTGLQAWRAAAFEVAFVGVLLAIGWAVLQDIVEGPQPGDIVCEMYDPRLGDCVVESVYEGE